LLPKIDNLIAVRRVVLNFSRTRLLCLFIVEKYRTALAKRYQYPTTTSVSPEFLNIWRSKARH